MQVNIVDKSPAEILNALFSGTDNSYVIKGRQITVFKKPAPSQKKGKTDHTEILRGIDVKILSLH